jgi:hypothetical protein
METTNKFYLSQDNDCHWYIIPLEKQQEWSKWCNLDSEDENSWEPPDFAIPINGNPSSVIFENPVIN